MRIRAQRTDAPLSAISALPPRAFTTSMPSWLRSRCVTRILGLCALFALLGSRALPASVVTQNPFEENYRSDTAKWPPRDGRWVLVKVNDRPATDGGQSMMGSRFAFANDNTQSSNGQVSTRFLIRDFAAGDEETPYSDRYVNASVSWSPPPVALTPGMKWGPGSGSLDPGSAEVRTRWFYSRALEPFNGAPVSRGGERGDGTAMLTVPTPLDADHPYFAIEVRATVRQSRPYLSRRLGQEGWFGGRDSITLNVTAAYYYNYEWKAWSEGGATTGLTLKAPADWQVIVGGAGLAAVAAGLAAAYWRRRRASGDKSTKPPEGPVGYVLQLSHDRFTLQADESAALTITVWAVDHTGATSLASGASIAIVAPAGLVAAPSAGAGRLVTHLRATKGLAAGAHAVAVTASAGGSAYRASVSVTAGEQYTYALELTPPALNLQRDGRETVRAFVKVTGPDPTQCQCESQRLGALVTLRLSGSAAPWFTESVHAEGGGKAGYLDLTIPENTAKLPGPHTASYAAQVDTPVGKLTQVCTITITTGQGFELAMDQRLRLQANDVAGSLVAVLRTLDDTIPDADKLIARATPSIRFALEGAQAHWLREEGRTPGQLRGDVSGSDTPAKEVHPMAEVPLADLGESSPFSATITASVDVPGHGSFTQAAAVDITPPKWFVELQPIKDKLQVGMTDAAVFRARVLPAEESKLPLYMEGTVNALNQYLTFYADGKAQPYTYIAEREGAGEFREYEVRLNDVPKDADLGEYLDMVAEATLCGQSTSQRFRINLSGRPQLEATPKAVTLVADGEPVELKLKVKNGDEFSWTLRIEVLDTGEVEPEGPPESDDGRHFTMRLRAGEGPEGGLGVRAGTLRAAAVTTHPETGEEIVTEKVDVSLKVGQVGLTVRPSPVRLATDPQGPPATFKVRVVRYNESTKTFESVTSAIKALDLGDWMDGDADSGANVFKGAGVSLTYVRTEGSGVNQVAIWSAKAKLVIPAAAPIDVERDLTAPGDWGDAQDRFTTTHKFVAPVDPVAQPVDKISLELTRCRKMLLFIPEGPKRDQLREVFERDAKNLGADGLYWQRQKIWAAARDCLTDEAESYLFSARMFDAAAEACDWVAYINGLIVQGLSTVLCPFPADMFVNLLYGALPDFVNAAFEGRAKAWPGEWVKGITEGAPGMAVDMTIGMALNLEDLIKQGLKDYKDLRKALVGACAVFWAARFARWYNSTRPDGEPYSLKEAVIAAVRDLAEEVITTGIGKNAKFVKDGMKPPGAKDWITDYDPTTGHGYDPKDGRVYHPTDTLPDTRGMPDANLTAARNIARKNGVEIYIRPTNAASRTLLEQGAIPKPEKIKAKTINELDLQLGRSKQDLGKVGYFDPGPNPPPQGKLSAKEYEDVVERYKQRKQEFVDNQKDFEKLSHDHTTTKADGTKVTERVTVDENGVVTNHTTVEPPGGNPVTTSKPYTGDHDVYDIRGKDGRPLTGEQYDKVMQELKDSKFAAQHPGHRQWDYSKADKYPPPPKKDAFGKHQPQQSKFKKAKGIDEKIRDGHQSTTKDGKPGESLIKVGSNGNVSGVYSNSPATMKTHTTGQRAVGAATSAERDRKGNAAGRDS